MTPRSTVILHGVYADALVGAAIGRRNARSIADNFPGFFGIGDRYLPGTHDQLTSKLKRNPHKQIALQMALIYDHVVLTGSGYSTQLVELRPEKLLNMPWVESISRERISDRTLGDIAVGDANESGTIDVGLFEIPEEDAVIEYAQWLKPIAIEALMRERTTFFDHFFRRNKAALSMIGVPKRQFYSTLFDGFFGIHIDHDFFERWDLACELILKNLPALSVRGRDDGVNRIDPYSMDSSEMKAQKIIAIDQESLDLIDLARHPGVFKLGFGTELLLAINDIMALLEMSHERDAVLVQSQYSLDHLAGDRGNWHGDASSRTLEAYQVLRLSFAEMIGALPRLESFEDVIRVKESHYRQIYRLREVLNEVETALRTGDSNYLSKADNEILLASQDLTRGMRLQSVSKWVSYLSLSIGSVGLTSMPMGVTSLGLALVGEATKFQSSRLRNRSGWLQVVR